MNTETDQDLTPAQWETLKALRVPAKTLCRLDPFVIEDLVALQLAAIHDNLPVITPRGRKALIRGSTRLWDLAA
jgi:hypothetical protein